MQISCGCPTELSLKVLKAILDETLSNLKVESVPAQGRALELDDL